MNRMIIATAALLVVGAPLALAETAPLIIPPKTEHRVHKDKVASVAMEQKCQALGYEFDTTSGKYKDAHSYLDAMQTAAQGKSFCAAHNATAGVEKYNLAFKILGVKPAA